METEQKTFLRKHAYCCSVVATVQTTNVK